MAGTEELIDSFVSLVPTLSKEEISFVDGPLTEKEIRYVIASLQMGQTPGPDGLGAKFYIHFQDLLFPLLLDLFKEAYCQDALPFTFYQGHHTILIPKTDDREILLHVES